MTHELARQLLRRDNMPVLVSVDVSTGDKNAGDRIFADIECVQFNGNIDATVISIEKE